MPASLLRPRDADALRAELRPVAAGLPVTFGGEVHGEALLVTEFVGTPPIACAGSPPPAGWSHELHIRDEVDRRMRMREAQLAYFGDTTASAEEIRAELRRLAADPDVLAQVALGCTNNEVAHGFR